MSKISSFKSIENKDDVHRSKDCLKKFCESLREQAMKIINFKKNEVINKWTAGIKWKCKNLLCCQEKFENKYVKDKNYCKVRDHCHSTEEYRSTVSLI